MNPCTVSDIKWNISLLEDIQKSIVCELEAWSTTIDMAIDNLEAYVKLLESKDDSNP